MTKIVYNPAISTRFRGFLPIVVDVETAGFNSEKDALLEVAAITIVMDEAGLVHPGEMTHDHIEPFLGANLEQASLEFTGIDPYHPFRLAKPETESLKAIFNVIRKAVKASDCHRAILVGHNPSFDLAFLNAAVKRTQIKRNPFHHFSTFDTVTLGGLAYGQTVLSRIATAAGLKWQEDKAHSARYDAQITAELFCIIMNRWLVLNDGKIDAGVFTDPGTTSEKTML